jgi:hypothetical protein
MVAEAMETMTLLEFYPLVLPMVWLSISKFTILN